MTRFLLTSAAFLVVLVTFGFISPAYAQDKSTPPAAEPSGVFPIPKIAMVDYQKILRESLAAQSLREQLDKIRRQERDKISKLEDALRDSRQEIDRQRTVLSPEAFGKKVQEWERKSGEHVRAAENRKAALDGAFEKSLGKIQSALVTIIQTISDEMKINLVFTRSQILFVDPDMNITNIIMASLNKKLPSVKFSIVDRPIGK
jgi:Skp family chaperone for outer membrane proteins